VALAAWRGIAALLLTKQGDWRKRVAKPEGFGPEHPEQRERLRALLEELQQREPLRAYPTLFIPSGNGRASRRCESCSCALRPS
jgi:hypothetical protein